MSFSAGTFSINSSGQPVITGTVISSTVFNALTADLATGLSTCVLKDGTQTVTANIPMAGFKITGLGAATAAGQAARYEQIPALSKPVIGTFTRDMTAASGNVAYTGVGFTPSKVIFFATVQATSRMSVGMDDTTTIACVFDQSPVIANTYSVNLTQSINMLEGNNITYQTAKVLSFDADGFTLTWTKNGAPTAGNATVIYMAFR